METLSPRKRKHGCFIAIVILLVLFGIIKGCTAYHNRPAALYERWLGEPVPSDVTELKGVYKFQLTESIAILSFKAPPERIAQIIKNNNFTPITATPHWSIPSDSRTITGGSYTGGEEWLGMSPARKKLIPDDLEIYWIPIHPESKISGRFLYYSALSNS